MGIQYKNDYLSNKYHICQCFWHIFMFSEHLQRIKTDHLILYSKIMCIWSYNDQEVLSTSVNKVNQIFSYQRTAAHITITIFHLVIKKVITDKHLSKKYLAHINKRETKKEAK